jgi:hypothetical protein
MMGDRSLGKAPEEQSGGTDGPRLRQANLSIDEFNALL